MTTNASFSAGYFSSKFILDPKFSSKVCVQSQRINIPNNIQVNSIVKTKDASRKNFCKEVLQEYSEGTTIHGIRYIGGKNRTIIERLWWVIVFLTSVGLCGYLITQTYLKWKGKPVIISFYPEQIPIWLLPFPAVTICPMNKILPTSYNYTKHFQNRHTLKGEEYKKFWDISLICRLDELWTFMKNENFSEHLNYTDENVIENIRMASPHLNITMQELFWQNAEIIDRESFFSEIITEEGLCFTFNMFNQKDLYTDEVNHETVFINHNFTNIGWEMEHGYPPSANIDDYPRRTTQDGYTSGLAFRLFYSMDKVDFVCGCPISGYKIMLHNPSETPRPGKEYFLAAPKQTFTLIVKPELTTTSLNLLSIPTDIRKCYFSHEKALRFFKQYTQDNCFTECLANASRQHCNCVLFSMPRDNKTKICGLAKLDCVDKLRLKMSEYGMLGELNKLNSENKNFAQYKIFSTCNCLPSCSDLKFTAESSQTEFNYNQRLIAAGFLDNQTVLNEKNEERLTKIDIFFKDTQFLGMHRSELVGQIDFIANIGGLLGLFMGFSFLSLLEIVYYLTIRLFVKFRMRN